MDKQTEIDLRQYAFGLATQLAPVHIDEEGVSFICPEYSVYEGAEEIFSYIATGKLPLKSVLVHREVEVKPDLNNKNIN